MPRIPPLAPSINTDFRGQFGPPPTRLRHIAQASFQQVQWCHHWNDDFLYRSADMKRIHQSLLRAGLVVADLHASSGKNMRWTSPSEPSRQAGIELVRNRIQLAGELGASAIVLHAEAEPNDEFGGSAYLDRVDRAIELLRPDMQRYNVRIAVENIFLPVGNLPVLHAILLRTDPSLVGFCYDSGHGQITGGGLEFLEAHRDRLIALHLHDNDGKEDRHRLPGNGTVDWPRLLRIIADSPYRGPMTMEMFQDDQCDGDIGEFLRQVKTTAERFAQSIEQLRQ